MKKSNIAGWKDVFNFTFVQTFKSKSFLISYLILILLAALSMPVLSMLTSGGSKDSNAPSPIKKVYVENKSSLPEVDFSGLLKENRFNHTSFVSMKEKPSTVSNRIENSENTSVILSISENKGAYSLSFAKAAKGPVKENDLETLGNAVEKQFYTYKINALGVTGKQISMINAKVDTKVSLLNAEGKTVVKKDTTISGTEYWFIYGLLFVVLMVNIFASTQIATSIVTEKSTKVIEYLLITVKPLALMVGKIIAMLSAVLIQMISLVIVMFVSNKVSAVITPGNTVDMLSKYLPSNIFKNLNIGNIIICLIVVFLGMVFYATLAGLAGATVSRIEEIQEGLMLFTFTNLIGAYIALGAANTLMGAGDNGFVTFAFLFPLSSPFLLPGSILVGKVGVPLIAASIILLVAFIILLFRFVAKVFETLILHNGNKIKIKELIKISKTV